MNSQHKLALAAAAVISAATLPCRAEPTADLILTGGRIVTLDPEQPVVQALAIRGGRVLAIGDADSMMRLKSDQTRVEPLDGRFACPGFIEGHGHFVSLGESKMMLDLRRAATWSEIVDRVASAAGRTPAGEWIVGRGWHQDKWSERPRLQVEGYPRHDALSRVTPNHPVILTHVSGHMLIANAAAMKLAGVDRSTPEVPGGTILRDEDGQPIGVFRETAQSLIGTAHQRSLRGRSEERLRSDLDRAIEWATRECLAHGITSFQDAGSSLDTIDVLRQWAERDKLRVRLWVMARDSNERLARGLAAVRTVGAGEDHLTVRAIKRSIDGALGAHGAWLLQPYDDLPGSTGLNTTPLSSLRETARLALKHDYQLCVHAIGDRANRETLDLFQEVLSDGDAPRRDHRWRIEHAQHLHPQDIPRFARLGVIASMQAVHCTSDAVFVVSRLGQRRAAEGAYVWRSLLDGGAVVVNGTDAPVEDIDPLACFYSAVTRRLPSGVEFFPEQAMTREEALRSYTTAAAYAAFEEQSKGTLSPGMLADVVVLSEDILRCPAERIRDARVEMTIVGGEILYRNGDPSSDPER